MLEDDSCVSSKTNFGKLAPRTKLVISYAFALNLLGKLLPGEVRGSWCFRGLSVKALLKQLHESSSLNGKCEDGNLSKPSLSTTSTIEINRYVTTWAF